MNLVVAAGDVVLLQGPNGVGKSTLLPTIAGVRRPLSGRALLRGRPTWSTRAKRDLGYVTDPPHLFEELTPGNI